MGYMATLQLAKKVDRICGAYSPSVSASQKQVCAVCVAPPVFCEIMQVTAIGKIHQRSGPVPPYYFEQFIFIRST